MTRLMTQASLAVCDLAIPVEVSALVRWPQCLGDVRAGDAKGQTMWNEIKDLVLGGTLQQASAT
jgi:hypothetical protein